MSSYGEIAINVLLDRGGFDGWWEEIHYDDQQEIIEEINEAVRAANVVVVDE